MTGARWFIVIVLLLTVGLVAVPYVMRHGGLSGDYEPVIYLTIDGKAVGHDVIIHARQYKSNTTKDIYMTCGKGKCHYQPHDQTEGDWTYYLEKFSSDLPEQALHSVAARKTYYNEHQTEIQWSIEATDQFDEFKKSSYTLAVNSTDKTVTAPKGERYAMTLEYLHLDADTVKIAGVVLVLVVIFLGLKFIPSGGHH